MKRICIDISNIIPGKGGSGGGIATYALNLINELDKIYDPATTEIICLKHKDFKGIHAERIKQTCISLNTQNAVIRVFWVQIYLPIYCLLYKIELLHRVTPELPLIKTSRYVCTLHDYMFDFYLNNQTLRQLMNWRQVFKFKMFRFITYSSLKISDLILVPSEAIYNETIKTNDKFKDKTQITYEASIVKRQPPAPRPDVTEKRLAVIAGFYPHKGHLQVIALAEKFIANGFTNFTIDFRGNPAYKGYINDLSIAIASAKLGDHIKFVKFDAQASLQNIYSNYDAFLLLSEYEGFGLPVLEAQANNIPVICSEIAVFKEILGNSAIFLPNSFDDDIIITDLIASLKNPEKLKEYIKLGNKNIEKFSWGKMAVETYFNYKNCLGIKVLS